MHENKEFITKKLKLEEELACRNVEIMKLTEKHLKLTSKIHSLKKLHQLQDEKKDEIIVLLKDKKKNVEEMYRRNTEGRWNQIKAEINIQNEMSNFGIYLNMMENHKTLTCNTSAEVPVKRVPVENEVSCSTSQASEDNTQRITLEAKSAELSINIAELQENITREEQRHSILIKKNAATLLKLRKDLQQSELLRKEAMEKCTLLEGLHQNK